MPIAKSNKQGAKQTFPYLIDPATYILLMNKTFTYVRFNKEEYAIYYINKNQQDALFIYIYMYVL